MQYMLLVYEAERDYEGAGQATLAEVVGKHMKLAEALREAGALVSGDGLEGVATATTIVTGADGAQTLHDGPFAETREQLGGYYLIDVPDLDAALGWARKVPVVFGGKVEVRPVMTY